MTLQEFTATYRLETSHQPEGIDYVITTRCKQRADSVIFRKVETRIDATEVGDFITMSQSRGSLTHWDWNDILDRIKRAHVDYFVMTIPIEERDFYPMNTEVDIAPLFA